MEMLLSLMSVALGVGGIIYAILTNREKKKLENVVKVSLSTTAGNIEKIRQSAHWAWEHFQIIHDNADRLPDSKDRTKINQSSQLGTGDSAAVERMLGNLLNEVLATQEGLFGTTERKHPDKKIKE